MTQQDSHDWRLIRMGEASCIGCAFWVPIRHGETIGECFRYAPSKPTLDEHEIRVAHKWPLTEAEDFCGEFRSRDSQ